MLAKKWYSCNKNVSWRKSPGSCRSKEQKNTHLLQCKLTVWERLFSMCPGNGMWIPIDTIRDEKLYVTHFKSLAGETQAKNVLKHKLPAFPCGQLDLKWMFTDCWEYLTALYFLDWGHLLWETLLYEASALWPWNLVLFQNALMKQLSSSSRGFQRRILGGSQVQDQYHSLGFLFSRAICQKMYWSSSIKGAFDFFPPDIPKLPINLTLKGIQEAKFKFYSARTRKASFSLSEPSKKKPGFKWIKIIKAVIFIILTDWQKAKIWAQRHL